MIETEIIEMDTATLLKQRNQMAVLLRRIAYPGRGSADERMTIQDAADLIQGAFSLPDLETWEPDSDLENIDVAHARMWLREAMRLAEKHNEETFYHSRRRK